MADVRNDPSMEEILASIKRIIADDSAVVINQPRTGRAPRAAANPAGDAPAPTVRARRVAEDAKPVAAPAGVVDRVTSEIFELTDQIAPEPQRQVDSAPVQSNSQPSGAPELISATTAEASRQAFAALAGQPVPPVQAAPAEDRTLEGLVREMLKPMLKEWLDARLPELVEGVVQREIARIAGRPL